MLSIDRMLLFSCRRVTYSQCSSADGSATVHCRYDSTYWYHVLVSRGDVSIVATIIALGNDLSLHIVRGMYTKLSFNHSMGCTQLTFFNVII